MRFLFPIVVAVVLCIPVLHADDSGPTEVAQAFYDGYMKVIAANGDRHAYVMGSDLLTAGFKSAYEQMMKIGFESDPVICGQEYPDNGFAAGPAQIDGDRATVTMTSRGDPLKHTFDVRLKNVDGSWLISDTNDLKADVEDS